MKNNFLKRLRSEKHLIILQTAAALTCAFLFDLFVPASDTCGTVYIIPLVLISQLHSKTAVLTTAIIISLLIPASCFISALTGPNYSCLTVDKLLCTSLIWIAALILTSRTAIHRKLKTAEYTIEKRKEAEQMAASIPE